MFSIEALIQTEDIYFVTWSVGN